MKPSLGRIVHYCNTDGIFAAMIVHVHIDTNLVNLVFWSENGEQYKVLNVPEQPTELVLQGIGTPNTWFWPPRV